MKKYEFQNYSSRRTAEVHTGIAGHESSWFVLYFTKGMLDDSFKGSAGCGMGEKRFGSEASAVRSAKSYVTKEA